MVSISLKNYESLHKFKSNTKEHAFIIKNTMKQNMKDVSIEVILVAAVIVLLEICCIDSNYYKCIHYQDNGTWFLASMTDNKSA